MNILEILVKRKSTRAFKELLGEEPLKKQICDIISLSNTAGNIKSVQYIFANEEQKKMCFFASGLQDVVNNAKLLLVLGNDDAMLNKKYSLDWIMNFGIQNSSIAAQNIILFLTEQGYESCWIGGFNQVFLKEKLRLKYTPWIMLAIGGRGEQS